MLSHTSATEVCCVELYAWLCGVNLKRASTDWFGHLSGKAQLAFLFLVEHIVVVVARTILYLLVVSLNVLTEWFWRSEVERCALNF